MPSADSLSQAERNRLERLCLQAAVDDYVEKPQRQAWAEQFARDAATRRSTRRERFRMLAIPVVVALLILAMVLFAAVLLSPRVPASPYGDAVGSPVEVQASLPRPGPRRCSPATGPLKEAARVTAECVGVDHRLVAAVVLTESSWRPHVVGQAGEYGPMQLSEPVAKRWKVDRRDPHENILGGTLHLRSLYERHGDWTRALTRYNGRGPMARAYAQRVLRAWEVSE